MFGNLLKTSSRDVGRRLLRDLAIILVLTIGAMTAATLFMGARLKQDMAVAQIEHATGAARQELRRLFDPARQLLLLARGWGKSGELDLADPEALSRRFTPALATVAQIEGLLIARDDGAEYFLLRDGASWLMRTRPPGQGPVQVRWQRLDDAGRAVEQWQERSDYDPRTRPWFEGAMALQDADKIYRTKPYIFYTRQVPGLTAAVRYSRGAGADRKYVFAIDLLLSDVADNVARFSVGGQGQAFLLGEDGALVLPTAQVEGSSRPRKYTGLLRPAGYARGDLLLDAAQHWQRMGGVRAEPQRFLTGDASWWAAFVPVYDDSDALWLGVVVPESDLLGLLPQKGSLLVAVAVAVLAVAISLAILLVAKYRRLLKNMPKTSIDAADPAGEIQSLIRTGEGANLEFKSTMRMNLRSGKPGKEIELAWLKSLVAFLNSDGGILLLGVSDQGEVLGLEADGFENEDKCRLHFKNLINQHIGLEHSRYIQFILQAVQDKLVAAVECERSPKPVFLTTGKEEDFYIRCGPASVKLSVSKVLQYLSKRG